MTDGQDELRRVHWDEIFGFSHVFKSFRMAIHPSKLLLALVAVALIYISGSLLDGVWSVGDGNVRRDTIAGHFYLGADAWDDALADWRNNRADRAAKEQAQAMIQKRNLDTYKSEYMEKMGVSVTGELYTAFSDIAQGQNDKDSDWKEPDLPALKNEAEDKWARTLGEAEDSFEDEVDRIEELLKPAKDDAEKTIKASSAATQDEALKKLKNELRLAQYALTARKKDFYQTVKDIEGQGIFRVLLIHEGRCLTNATLALCRGDISSGLSDYQANLRGDGEDAVSADQTFTFGDAGKGGVLYWALTAGRGGCWLLSEHQVFAGILLVIWLAIWSLFGGAIHRIAALQAAREEKISMRQALKFSAGKFFSFFTAPLIPLAGIVIIGLGIAIGGLLGNIPGLGALYLGLLCGLALLAGFIIALATIGLLGGGGLMYPTIAVEGSDSFDAMSRSFSYVFSKPWRAVLYSLVAMAHGAVCYLFVRGFALILLKCTRFWADVGIWQGGETLPGAPNKLVLMWPDPTFASLHGPIPSEALTGMEYAGALLMAFWVYIVIGLVAAFVLSYASSATTVIYYLLRRKVDATDLDDVYVEEADQEQALAGEPEESPAEAEEPEGQDSEPPAEDAPSEPQEDEEQGEEDEEQGEEEEQEEQK